MCTWYFYDADCKLDIPAQICTSLWFKLHFLLYLLFFFLIFSHQDKFLIRENLLHIKPDSDSDGVVYHRVYDNLEFCHRYLIHQFKYLFERESRWREQKTRRLFFLFPLVLLVSSGIQSRIVWEVFNSVTQFYVFCQTRERSHIWIRKQKGINNRLITSFSQIIDICF